MKGVFITFEGTEGSGKSTQIVVLEGRLRQLGYPVMRLREPGGTPIGEEIRHTLKHSASNHAMTWQTELLLMNASRAQLVHEVIKPALAAGKIVLCDRFSDSTIAYQGHGRELDLGEVRKIISFATGGLSPDLTLFLQVRLAVSEARRSARQAPEGQTRDRLEESDRAFFQRVEKGYELIALAEPDRVQIINGELDQATVSEHVWNAVRPVVERITAPGMNTFKSVGEWETDKLSAES